MTKSRSMSEEKTRELVKFKKGLPQETAKTTKKLRQPADHGLIGRFTSRSLSEILSVNIWEGHRINILCLENLKGIEFSLLLLLFADVNSKEMQSGNQISVSHFILVCLHYPPQLGISLFLAFLVIYALTISGNELIILTVLVDTQLHRPMYWFLCHLSFLDMTISSAIVPKMLADFLLDSKMISFGGCVIQLFSFHFLGCTECFLYTLMAYDYFLAICKPLHYATIMTRRVCNFLAFGTWLRGTLHSLFKTSFMFRLPFYGPNHTDYLFCDIPAMLCLACADSTINKLVIFVDIGFLALTCFMLILTSYGYIVAAILWIRSAEGRCNTFSTCAAHLIVIIYCVPLAFICLHLGSQEPLDEVVAIFYTVITPLLNLIIYTLHNKEMKAALWKLRGCKVLQPL
ncbi:LOW QUALITY PROTEIN: olfactory receptor 10G6-like [Pteropus alecto]|uniref:LOW QUALITY PROTEIN: olfactory receptor 10G6-like n=1 Tax=Pteropus alecto TaxID=9402 RepID=UPI00076863A7|nr:LOW QUALITY PROTEIN: olfactory receptor 10G6-like [Pteropus alecto]